MQYIYIYLKTLMDILDIIFIGVALSMDACALTIANCVEQGNCLTKKQAWAMPTMFALFQGVMPLIGYFIGSLFYEYIGAYGKYLTALIFFALGIKMIIDVVKEKKCGDEKACECVNKKLTLGVIAIQAVATSLDALIVGITLNEYTLPFYVSVIIIAVVTFLLVALALLLGKTLGKILGKYSNYVAIVIILLLAIKSLIF